MPVIKLKKAAVWIGAVATIPVALVLGFVVADPFYMRFIFDGDRKDFSPGDSFGVLVWALIFSAVIIIPAMFGWWKLYRRLSQMGLSKA